MKSRIRSAIPKKIIGINISSQKRDIIEDIAKSENSKVLNIIRNSTKPLRYAGK